MLTQTCFLRIEKLIHGFFIDLKRLIWSACANKSFAITYKIFICQIQYVHLFHLMRCQPKRLINLSQFYYSGCYKISTYFQTYTPNFSDNKINRVRICGVMELTTKYVFNKMIKLWQFKMNFKRENVLKLQLVMNIKKLGASRNICTQIRK